MNGETMKEDTFKLILCVVILMIAIIISWNVPYHNNGDRVEISKLGEGVGLQLCGEYQKSSLIICKDNPSLGGFLITNNTEQLEVDNYIKECPSAFVTTTDWCKKNTLMVRGQ